MRGCTQKGLGCARRPETTVPLFATSQSPWIDWRCASPRPRNLVALLLSCRMCGCGWHFARVCNEHAHAGCACRLGRDRCGMYSVVNWYIALFSAPARARPRPPAGPPPVGVATRAGPSRPPRGRGRAGRAINHQRASWLLAPGVSALFIMNQYSKLT
jgi:hypothetical protein